ncbi:uncharacterized protein LOC110919440 [Helianthus annuus]|uniref:uncharacterized protein LOC110919440 n=1 Tax=Helianthus annuus TaxID=4232 RepID=UPI000B90344F|nr:uncharacterized protein LOC110919440 [Helianthus annuus]
MEITERNSIGGPSTKLGFDKSKAIYHRNREEPPRMKQIEETPKEKSRALAVIHDDKGFDWSEFLPKEDAEGYAFMAKVEPYKDTRTEEQKYNYRKLIAQTMKDRNYRAWKEAKKRMNKKRERERDQAKKAEEEELKSRKVDDGIIDTTKEMTAENLTKMADKVLMAKELEVDSKSASESTNKVSCSGSTNKLGKTDKAKKESDCKNCMKECKVCITNAYLTVKKTEVLTTKVKMVEDQILSRDKLKENEKLIHENRQHSENHEKLKEQLKILMKEMEAKIENEIINLKLNSYSSASFVLQHIVPKPIGKNKAGEDVYSDGTGVETIDVTFTSSSDEDNVQSEVVKNVVENVLKSDSDSTEDEECFLNNYIPKSKSQNNSNDEPTLVLYKMSGSDKLYSDIDFPLENVNVDKLKKVFKLVEIDVSEVEASSQQTWKPKSEDKTTSSPNSKVSESAKQSSSTKKMNVSLDFYEKLEKQTSTPPGKKYVLKKDQSSGQPPEKEFFLYKEVEIGSEESLKMNDKNFPPLYTATTHINVKLPEWKEAWVASKSN